MTRGVLAGLVFGLAVAAVLLAMAAVQIEQAKPVPPGAAPVVRQVLPPVAPQPAAAVAPAPPGAARIFHDAGAPSRPVPPPRPVALSAGTALPALAAPPAPALIDLSAVAPPVLLRIGPTERDGAAAPPAAV
ncbi:hypothetical protein ICN82_13555, partial [Mangrovicoccus sp. HB182678]|nr:hypothetical protein [Mangrovicoccus algicola]